MIDGDSNIFINKDLDEKIFSDHELQEDVTIRKFRIVQTEGSLQVNREVKHYIYKSLLLLGLR